MASAAAEGLLLGIDSGQTVCKAALFDLDGREVAVARESTAVRSPQPRWLERDPDQLWDQVCRAVRTVLARTGAAAQVLGVGICAHGDGIYLLDDAGRPVRPAILATDSRAQQQAQEFGTGETGRRALALTGQLPFAGSPASLLAWLARHEPGALDAARWALFCKDVIRHRLTGEVATDPTDASASFTALTAPVWSPEAFALYGLPWAARLMPPIRGSATVAGQIDPTGAAATGLRAGTPVACGSHDVDAAAIGVGAHRPGDVSVLLGTFSINQVLADRAVAGPAWQARAWVEPRRWLHMSTSPAGAANLDWVLRQMGPTTPAGEVDPVAAIAQARPALETPARAAQAPLFLPFLFGAPHGITAGAGWVQARGWHDRADLLYAVLEGIAFNHRHHLDALAGAFTMDRPVRLGGGGARSAAWTQLFADVTGRAVQVSDAEEAGARGAAMLAGIASGVYPDLASAVARCVRVRAVVEPRAPFVELCRERFGHYRRVVTAVGDSGATLGRTGDPRSA